MLTLLIIPPSMHATPAYQAGFIHILGQPNVGKSTLLNRLIQYPLSIASPKPQTTRQNILGIDQGPHYQAIYLDTPGYLEPHYLLQEMMLRNVQRALVGSDILLWVIDASNTSSDPFLTRYVHPDETPFLLLLNKSDLLSPAEGAAALAHWKKQIPATDHLLLSAHNTAQVAMLRQQLINLLPHHPPYYDTDSLSDRSERFFAAEIIRKACLQHYHQEIPYSIQVVIDRFEEKTHVIIIDSILYVARKSQKAIVIGHRGQALKAVGVTGRQELSLFFKKKIYLNQRVSVLPNWRDRKRYLQQWGYC